MTLVAGTGLPRQTSFATPSRKGISTLAIPDTPSGNTEDSATENLIPTKHCVDYKDCIDHYQSNKQPPWPVRSITIYISCKIHIQRQTHCE